MLSKAQISIEYLILTGFIVLVIVIPAVIFLSSLANKSVYGTLSNQKATDLGNGLVDNAKQMYYLGLYSKKVVNYDVPQNVKRMFILDLNDSNGKEYYYIGLIVDDGKEVTKFFFPSEVPLTSDFPAITIGNLDPGYSNISVYVNECAPATSCVFYDFQAPVIHEGKKSFRIETIYSSIGDVKVSIIPTNTTY
jgi:uncharacterized protein (UPF0333 family)